MVDGLHIHTWNGMMKPLKTALNGAQTEGCRGWRGDVGDNLTNVQCKVIGNWHNESPYTINICY
jgi:hypothetical protein